jgi:O-antigen/teichoic acid export membrane protein
MLFNRILSVSIWSGLAKALFFIVSIYLARTLSVDIYGEYVFYLTIFNTIFMLTDLRINQVIVPILRMSKDKVSIILSYIAAEMVVFSSIFIIGYLIWISELLNLDNGIFKYWMYGVIFVFGMIIRRVVIAIGQSLEKFWIFNSATVVYPLIFLVITYTFSQNDSAVTTLIQRVYSIGIPMSLISIFLFVYFLKNHNLLFFNTKDIQAHVIKIFSHVKHTILISLLVLIYSNSDRIMLGVLLVDSKDVAYYANGVMLGILITHILSSAVSSIYPSFVKSYKSGNLNTTINHLENYKKLIHYLIMPMSLVLALNSEFIVTIFFGSEYKQSGTIFLLWILFLPLFNLTSLVSKFIYIDSLYVPYYPILIFSVVLNLILNYVFIPIYGATSAIIISIVTYGINMMYPAYLGYKLVGFNVFKGSLFYMYLALSFYIVFLEFN